MKIRPLLRLKNLLCLKTSLEAFLAG